MIRPLRERLPHDAVPVMAALDTSGVRSSDIVTAVSASCHDLEPSTMFVDLRDCGMEDKEEKICKYLGMGPAEYRAVYTDGLPPDTVSEAVQGLLHPALFTHKTGDRSIPLLVTYSTKFQMRFLKKLGISPDDAVYQPLDVVLYAALLSKVQAGEIPVYEDFSMDWNSFIDELEGLRRSCKAPYRVVFSDYGIPEPVRPVDKVTAIRSLFGHVLDVQL